MNTLKHKNTFKKKNNPIKKNKSFKDEKKKVLNQRAPTQRRYN